MDIASHVQLSPLNDKAYETVHEPNKCTPIRQEKKSRLTIVGLISVLVWARRSLLFLAQRIFLRAWYLRTCLPKSSLTWLPLLVANKYCWLQLFAQIQSSIFVHPGVCLSFPGKTWIFMPDYSSSHRYSPLKREKRAGTILKLGLTMGFRFPDVGPRQIQTYNLDHTPLGAHCESLCYSHLHWKHSHRWPSWARPPLALHHTEGHPSSNGSWSTFGPLVLAWMVSGASLTKSGGLTWCELLLESSWAQLISLKRGADETKKSPIGENATRDDFLERVSSTRKLNHALKIG